MRASERLPSPGTFRKLLFLIGLIAAGMLISSCARKKLPQGPQAPSSFWLPTALDSSALTVTAAPNGYVYAGTLGQHPGIFVTADRGASWSALAVPGLVNRESIQLLAVRAADGLLCLSLHNGMNSRLFFSKNGARTWMDARLPAGIHLESLTFSPDGKVIVCSQSHDESAGGVFWTDDLGGSWQEITALRNRRTRSVIVWEDGTWLAGGGSGLYRSSDGGQWEHLGTNLTHPVFSVLKLGPEGNVWGWLYGRGLFVSEDRGETWQATNMTEPYLENSGRLAFWPGGFLLVAFLDFVDFPRLPGFYYSTDGGQHWKRAIDGLSVLSLHSLTVDRDGFVYLAVQGNPTGGGVFRSALPVSQWPSTSVEE